jgi:hypothetical protein
VRRRRRFSIVLALALTLASPGCVGWGRASFKTYDWSFSTFQANPVAQWPFYVSFFLFAVAGVPLDLVSWPATALFFPKEDRALTADYYWFSAAGPSVFLGAGGGTILGGIFYVFGLPFMGDSEEPKDWNDVKAPSDDEPLTPPPGGTAPPPGGTTPPEKPK